MTKSKSKPPDAILTTDWHIRPDQPIARIDDFWSALSGKILFIIDRARTYKCPILLAGDLGHRPGPRNWPFWLLYWCMTTLSQAEIIAIAGQHDLPDHQLDLLNESGMGVLSKADVINVAMNPALIKNTFGIFPFHFGEGLGKVGTSGGPCVAITHQMIIQNRELWPGQKAPKGHEILKKYPQYNLILSGDNHHAFTAEYEGRWLVNPGSLMRAHADQVDHKPRVYLWWADTNEIEKVYIPIQQDVLSREHIEKKNHRENRFQSFVKQTEKTWNKGELSLSFKNNMEIYFSKNRLRKPVKAKIIKAMP